MHVKLEVVSSVQIKRKKPWNRIAWIGQEKENLLLLEDHRASILYIPSGKTKRKIAKLNPLLKNCVKLNYTRNGSFVFGLLNSGGVFLWHKDTDTVTHLVGLGDLKSRSISSDAKWQLRVFADDSGRRVLVVAYGSSMTEVFLCEHLCGGVDSSDRWWRMSTDHVGIPQRDTPKLGKETAVDACFMQSSLLGHSVQCIFVYSSATSVCIATIIVTSITRLGTSLAHRWSTMKLPAAQPMLRRGSYLVRWSNDGCIAAVVVNQKSASDSKVFFVSVHCNVIVAARLPSDGCTPEHESRRHHWACDAAWTYGDLFLVVINRLGSVCLLSKLGDPMIISCQGCSMDLPPTPSLSVHPLVFVRNVATTNVDNSVTTTTSECILKQKFSVTTHPRLPLVLCSDGYLVTCFQLPKSLSDPHPAVYVYLREAQKSVRRMGKLLNMTGVQLRTSVRASRPSSKVRTSNRSRNGLWTSSFTALETQVMQLKEEPPSKHNQEEAQSDIDVDDDSESSADRSAHVVHRLSSIGNTEHGVLSFGAHESDLRSLENTIMSSTVDDCVSDLQKEAISCILAAWSIVATTLETWTVEWETRCKNVAEILNKLFSFSACQNSCFEDGLESCGSNVLWSIQKAIALVSRFLLLCRFDGIGKNTLPVILYVMKFVVKTVLDQVCDEEFDVKLDVLAFIESFVALARDTIVDTFTWNPSKYILPSLAHRCLFSQDSYRPSEVPPAVSTAAFSRASVAQRLISVWRKLYKFTSGLYATKDSEVASLHLSIVLGRIQAAICDLSYSIEKTRGIRLTPDQRRFFLVANDREAMINKWQQEAEFLVQGQRNDESDKKLTKLLHAILYFYLGHYRTREAVRFVTRLLAFRGSSTLSLTPVRRTLRSFARFVASYFLARPMFVHPWHNPRPLPNLRRRNQSVRCRRVFLDRNKIEGCMEDCDVNMLWSVDVAVTLLLVTRCLPEAAGLVAAVGDSKSTFVLNVAMTLFQKKPSTNSHLVLMQHLWSVLKHGIDFTKHGGVFEVDPFRQVEDCFVAATLGDVNILPSVLKSFLIEFKTLTQSLDELLVPDSIYLPRPPIYCLQLKDPVTSEDHVVTQLWHILHLVRVVLASSHCLVPVIHFYVAELRKVAQNVTPDGDELSDWPLENILHKLNGLHPTSEVAYDVECPELEELTDCFRDFCALSWFFYVRDKASRTFRTFLKNVEGAKLRQLKRIASAASLEVLQWVVRLVPFAEFMGWDLDVYEMIFAVLLEGPADERATAVLARCFPDTATIPDELEYRLSRLLAVWRDSTVKGPNNRRVTFHNNNNNNKLKPSSVSGKSLSDIYREQCHEMNELMEKLRAALGDFEENVFTTEQSSEKRVRPFEVDRCYYEFMELLLEVGFLRDVGAPLSAPLLPSAKTYVVREHLSSMPTLLMTHAKPELASLPVELNPMASSSLSQKSTKKLGLFRSLSLDDLRTSIVLPSTTALSDACQSKGRTSKKGFAAGSTVEGTVRRHSLDERLPFGSSTLLFLCDTYALEQMSLYDSPRKDTLIKMFQWLVQWTERDNRMSVKDQMVKVRLDVPQIFSVQWETADGRHNETHSPTTSVGHEPSSDHWSLTEVTAREFTTSTPVLDVGLTSTRDSEEPHEDPKTCDLTSSTTKPKDFMSEYFRQLKKYVENDVSFDSSLDSSSALGVSSLPSDGGGSVTEQFITDIRLLKDVKEDTESFTTSRWSSSSTKSVGSRALTVDDQPKPHLHKESSKSIHEETGNPQSMPKATNDVACGDVAAWPDLVSACVQVNDSLLQHHHQRIEVDSYNSHEKRNYRTGHDEDTLDGVSSPDTTPVCPRSEKLTRQKRVDPVERRYAIATERDPHKRRAWIRMSVYDDLDDAVLRIPVLRLPAEREFCLLDSRMLPRLSGSSRHKSRSSRHDKKNKHDHQRKGQPVDQLSSDKSRLPRHKGNDPVPQSRSFSRTSSPHKEPRRLVDEAQSPVHLHRNESKSKLVDMSVGTTDGDPSWVRPVLRRDVGTDMRYDHHRRTVDAHTSTKVASVSVAVGTEQTWSGLEMVDRASSPASPRWQATSTEKSESERRVCEVGLSTTRVVYQTRMTQTEHVKQVPTVRRDVCVNTSETRAVRSPVAAAVALFEGRVMSSRDTENSNANRARPKLNEQVIYQKMEVADDLVRELQSEMANTKNYLERLETASEPILPEEQVGSDRYLVDKEERGRNESQAMPPPLVIRCESKPAVKQRVDGERNELRAWMHRKSLQQRKEFVSKLEELKSKERKPFVVKGPPVTSKEIFEMEEARRDRRKKLSVAHYLARTEEAMRLLQDLVQSEVPSTTKWQNLPAWRRPSSKSTSKLSTSENNVQNLTYVLHRGLVPFAPNQKIGKTRSDATAESFSVRKPKPVLRRASSAVSADIAECRNGTVRVSPLPLAYRRSPSWDSLSSWSVPSEVRRLLYSDYSTNDILDMDEQNGWSDEDSVSNTLHSDELRRILHTSN